ncbi:NADH-quinone oxidoreductase subunit K [Kamptonema cortianum]|nr:NADH-quinone oxidoreductase subunit K [Geitlerinema splendidum]MDK3158493.1 NADH-quinone oxidoreductase subunit K [Kamptonema cortianum]
MSVDLLVAILIGVLFGTGTYLMLRRSTTKLLLGLVLLSNATNLVVFTCAKLVRGRAPLIQPGSKSLEAPYADPLGQALILTAIVISFGVLAFAMVLARRGYDAFNTDDTDCMVEEES